MHVIFDLDGTLIDSRRGILDSLDFVNHKIFKGVLVCSESHIGPPIAEMLRGFFLDISIEEAEVEFRQHYDSQGWRGYQLYKDVDIVLTHLLSQDYKLSIATNKPKIPTYKIIEDSGISEYFDNIVTFNKLEYSSKSDMVKKIMDQVNDECIMVGDSYDDLKAANDNKIQFINCSYGYGKVSEYYGQKVNEFSELMKVL